MKILHTADWHIGQFKGPVVDGVNLRSQDTVKCLEYMVQVRLVSSIRNGLSEKCCHVQQESARYINWHLHAI